MCPMQITVTGIDHLLERLERLADLREKCWEIAKRLCEVGEPIIRATHGNHAIVATEPTDDGYVIRADGEDVLFIEFGTGDKAGEMSANYDSVPTEVAPGTWSAGHAQMYSRYGFWVFAGKIYHYTEPHPAFYDAYQAMVEALPKIANEVFAA